MATIRKHRNKWQVQVRLKGHPPLSKTFLKRSDALYWARKTESAIQRGDLKPGQTSAQGVTLRDLLRRYRDSITVKKRWASNERYQVEALMRERFASQEIANFNPASLAAYRDKRAAKFSASTVNHELQILSHTFKLATQEWGYVVPNPVANIRRVKADRSRDRRLSDAELAEIRIAAARCRNKTVMPVVLFALETGMRRGEILNVEWPHVDWEKRTLSIPLTKTDVPRTIPLSTSAIAILKNQRDKRRPFGITVQAFRLSWERLLRRTTIKDLHFHDLRHEAISRFFERGLSVPEVALISGHRDYRMLARYTHLRAEDVAKKIA